MPHIAAAGRSISYQMLDGGRSDAAFPTLVFLHEGLGSIRQWRDFPGKVAAATGCRALVYDRYGYGDSDVLQEARAGVDFMHREALLFLPEILRELKAQDPILIGHSDGASISLIYAGSHPVRGLVVMAPHVYVEEFNLNSIRKITADFETSGLKAGLAKYHRDAAKTFRLWSDAWLDPEFPKWNIEACLPGIRCPLLAIQGEADEYGTMAQLEAIARQVKGSCELLQLPGCGHAPFKDRPGEVLSAVTAFVKRILGSNP